MALLVLFTTAARTRVVTTNLGSGVAQRTGMLLGNGSTLSLRFLRLRLFVIGVLILNVLHLNGTGCFSFCLLNLFLCLNTHRHEDTYDVITHAIEHA